MKFMKKVKFVHRLLDQTLAGWPAGTFVIMKLSARTSYKSFLCFQRSFPAIGWNWSSKWTLAPWTKWRFRDICPGSRPGIRNKCTVTNQKAHNRMKSLLKFADSLNVRRMLGVFDEFTPCCALFRALRHMGHFRMEFAWILSFGLGEFLPRNVSGDRDWIGQFCHFLV